MLPVKISEGVHWVGALDPQLRVFDIIMKADHGTTYNSYLITGGERAAGVVTSDAQIYVGVFEGGGWVVGPRGSGYVFL